jgi:DNA-binding beta-propeller fold protein YncE
MAVNDDGTLVVYAVKAPDGESVYAWTTSAGTPRFLASAGSVSGIAISASGHAILTDRDANEVFAIWNVEGGAIRRPFADVTEGVSKPSGVAAAGNRIYIANSGSANIIVLDAEGRFVKALPCNCTISGLHTFRESIYRVTDGIHQTLYLLDASSAQERILFVPPPQD